MSAVNKILRAYNNNKNFIKNTLLEKNNRLSAKYGCNIFFKREDLQEVRSFKIRGAYNKINSLDEDQKKNGITAASAGNHGASVAYCANKLGIKADIFVPSNTPNQKINAIKKFLGQNSKLHIAGENFDTAFDLSKKYCEDNKSVFIHPFGDHDVILGQGTIAHEIYSAISPDLIISCLGGGGLVSGISLYSKNINPNCLIYGVEPKGCAAMYESLKENKIVKLEKFDSWVDGASVQEVSEATFNICKDNLDKIILVPNGKLSQTMLELYTEEGIVTEPAGSLSVSALDFIDKDLIKDKNVVCIISGANNDVSRYAEIQEMALRYENLKHYFIVNFNQKPGELKKFVNNILSVNDDITRFEYIKKNNRTYGQCLIGIQLGKPENIEYIKDNFNTNNINYIHINENEQLMNYLV